MEKFAYFDCHADTLTEIPAQSAENLYRNHRDIDLERTGQFTNRYTQIFAIWKDAHTIPEGKQTEVFRGLYQRAAALLDECSGSIGLCRTAEDMDRCHSQGRSAAFLSVEDLSVAGEEAEHLADLGVRFVILTWNYENEYGCGSATSQSEGLTEQGKEMVRELVRQGIILDVSHLSDAGIDDVLSLTGRPVMASHSNVRSVRNVPRNLQDVHLREIIRRKGIVGMNLFAPFVGENPGMEDIACHMDAVLSAGGEDALAFGGDFDGSDGLFPKGITGVESIPALREFLAGHGYTEALLNRIFAENAENFIKRNLSKEHR